jgi:hypothetical protein
MSPYCVLKTGDTRLSRFERGEPYVMPGIVAGRMDKEGASAAKIVLAELAEEVGGQVVDGTFLPLSSEPCPTMPGESTEADCYFLAAVEIAGTPYGDGGAMEVVDLIGPLLLPASEALAAMLEGGIAESARAQTMFTRGLDLIGFLPSLGLYVHDHPRLLKAFDTLGLGQLIDLREMVDGGPIPAGPARGETLESRINEVVCSSREEHILDEHSVMIAASTHHAVREGSTLTTLGSTFLNQYLRLDYDRAKVARYYVDDSRGPMVEMSSRCYPALAFAPRTLQPVRQDVLDLALERSKDPLEQVAARWGGSPWLLGRKTSASSGQSDLYYYMVALPVAPEEGFLTLSEAIRLCRAGHGDAHTEALLRRLADELGWLPGLSMTVGQARELL